MIGRDVTSWVKSREELRDMLAMRMRWTGGESPFQHLNIHKHDEIVYLFIVQAGKALVVDDDAGLFPSDKLITQLRLLEK